MTCAEIVNGMLKKTEEGRVADWVERLYHLVKPVGIDATQIYWGGSPASAAWSIYEEADRRKKLPAIEALLR
jgi:hypothetical protein